MAAFAEQQHRPVTSAGWLHPLKSLLAHELAPSPRRFWTSLRIVTVATFGTALIASCHVNSELGTYIVWLVVGAGPMMSARKAIQVLAMEAVALVFALVMSRVLAETPWLMLPFLFSFMAWSTYFTISRGLGAAGLLIQVVCLATFYGVIFAPQEIGWTAAGTFGGSVIAYGVIVLFDNWVWPDPADSILIKALAASAGRERDHLVEAARFYLDRNTAPRPPEPPPTSDLPDHLALLDRVVVEGASARHRAVLLAAVATMARIHIEVDRLVTTARQNVPNQIRTMSQFEIQIAVDAIAAALDAFARDAQLLIRISADQPPPLAARVGQAMDALSTRILQVRPSYIGKAGAAEISNLAAFTDCLTALARLLQHPGYTPPSDSGPISPLPSASPPKNAVDPQLVRHCLKVGLCSIIGYVAGVWSQRPELEVILTTVIITALPNYGAALRKMILRIVGALLGGLVSLVTIMVITPNFESLPAYLVAVFIVLYVSAYSSLSSGRIAYAGKQIGTTFVLVFAGLSPSAEIYTPLWRIWGILLGTVIVALVFLILWPAYAGDSLLPRLRKVLRDTIALAPGGLASASVSAIETTNAETMQVLAQMLAVADDAQLEGRNSTVDGDAIVRSAGTLRRIANRLAAISMGRILAPLPQLDESTESARRATLSATRARLEAWLSFFARDASFGRLEAASALIGGGEIMPPLEEFSHRLEAQGFSRLSAWTLDQRRVILAELESMRRLEFLIVELDRYLSAVAQPPHAEAHARS
jgi:uncharacterized membrane protein YccC